MSILTHGLNIAGVDGFHGRVHGWTGWGWGGVMGVLVNGWTSKQEDIPFIDGDRHLTPGHDPFRPRPTIHFCSLLKKISSYFQFHQLESIEALEVQGKGKEGSSDHMREC